MRFYFHYNKPASMQAGEPRLSVHADGRCHIVKAVDCRVPVRTKNNNRQPRCVMIGDGSVRVRSGVAVIS